MRSAENLVRAAAVEGLAVRRIGTITGYIPKYQLIVDQKQLVANVRTRFSSCQLFEGGEVNPAMHLEWNPDTACQK
jgi:hypothetical protein